MKILSWNCNGAFRKKLHLLDEFDADIYIIQECENPEQAKGVYEQWYSNLIWKGQNKNKGLAIFAKDHIILEQLDWEDHPLELFLPIRINNTINLLAVWTKQANSPTFAYIGQLWKYLQLHKNQLADQPSIICGDWNSNAIWDVWDRWWNHSDVVKELENLNIQSVYHHLSQEKQGEEKLHTFFMNRKESKPYHIDYLFCSNIYFDLDNSTYHFPDKIKWLEHSDHIPIFFDLETNNKL